MNKPKYQKDSLSNDEYQILFFEIENQLLINALVEATGSSKEDLVIVYGNYAIELINSRSTQENLDCVNQLQQLFVNQIILEFNDE